MVLYQIFYRVAFFVTALIHLWFNDLVNAAVKTALLCLSNSSRPIIQSILQLHSVVLVCFVLAFCFNAVSALPEQMILGGHCDILNFDDIETPEGFGNITIPYRSLIFNEFFAFSPAHPDLEGIISANDLNCAVSKPNALYGAKVTKQSPSIQAYDPSLTFAVHSLKIKPLDMPVGSVTINLHGVFPNTAEGPLIWSVDFPAGFHDVLHVRLEEFTKLSWKGLAKLEVWANFHFNGIEMEDWEFCIDDLETEIEYAS